MNTLQEQEIGPTTGNRPIGPDDFDLRCLVTFRRDHADDAQQRQIVVRLDEAAPATLMYGEHTTMEVAPGRHLLRANNTLFWKRQSFSIEPGEHLEFVLVNRAGRLTLGFLAVIGVAPLYLDIIRQSRT